MKDFKSGDIIVGIDDVYVNGKRFITKMKKYKIITYNEIHNGFTIILDNKTESAFNIIRLDLSSEYCLFYSLNQTRLEKIKSLNL